MDLYGVPVHFNNKQYFLNVKDDIRLVVEVSKTLEYLLRKNFVVREVIKDDATLGRVIRASNLPKPLKVMIFKHLVNPRNMLVHKIEQNSLPPWLRKEFARNATRILFDVLPEQMDINRDLIYARQELHGDIVVYGQSALGPRRPANKGFVGVVRARIIAVRDAILSAKMRFVRSSKISKLAGIVLLGFLTAGLIHIATSGLDGAVFAGVIGGVGAGLFWTTLSFMNNIYFEMKEWWLIRIGPPKNSDCSSTLKRCNRNADKLYDDFSDLLEPGCVYESNKMYFGVYGEENQLRNIMINLPGFVFGLYSLWWLFI